MTEGLQLKYFVLRPTKDNPDGEASRLAMRAYANAIRPTNMKLSIELDHWVSSCRHKIIEIRILANAKGATNDRR